MEFKTLSLCMIVYLCALLSKVQPSAIPMWELLSKDEKRSFLYSLFANQVEELCETSNGGCSQELLKYGLTTLKDMTEGDLDNLDPYQRGANNLIWESMLSGHAMMKTTPKPETIQTTAKPNSYDDQSFTTDFGSQSEESAKVENARILPPADFVYKMESSIPQYVYPNQIQYFRKQSVSSTNTPSQRDNSKKAGSYVDTPLTGPMVVKVYPDGRLVDFPYQPHDEDLRQYQLSKVKIPNL